MSGPMQWTPQGMVPAGSPRPASDVPTLGVVQPLEPHDDDDLGSAEGQAIAATARAAISRKAVVVPAKPLNVVKLALARLREVDREIKHLRKLEEERCELRRLLDAAKAKPRANLRELPKRSAG